MSTTVRKVVIGARMNEEVGVEDKVEMMGWMHEVGGLCANKRLGQR